MPDVARVHDDALDDEGRLHETDGTVPQRIHWFSRFWPCEPSFTIFSIVGTTLPRMLKMMEDEM